MQVNGVHSAVAATEPAGYAGPAPRPKATFNVAEAIADAQRLLGEAAMKVANEEMQQNMKEWQANRKLRVDAATRSFDEEKTAMNWRFATKLAMGLMSVTGGAVQVAGGGIAARNQIKASRLGTAAEHDVASSRQLFSETNAETNPMLHAERQEALGLAEKYLRDSNVQVTIINATANKWNNGAMVARSAEQGLGSVTQGVGDMGSTPAEIKRKQQDLAGQMLDGNVSLERDLAERRRADANDARKRNDEANQIRVEIDRAIARSLAV